MERIFSAVAQIVFVDDSPREGSEDDLLKFLAHHRRVIGRNQFHLSGERKVEVEKTIMRAVANSVINGSVAAHLPPGMQAV